MSEMVERVARALCEDCGLDWETSMKDGWRRQARAAIEAMMEPTEEMVVSGAKELAEEDQWDRLGELPREYLRIDARATYDAMIDEALK